MTIGLAVITFNRPHYLKACLKALERNNWGGATEIIVVLDEPFTEKYLFLSLSSFPGVVPKWFDGPNRGVGHAKNVAFRELLNRECDHIFLMEDDIIMTDPNTCKNYIQYAQEHNLHHLNFAHHGSGNHGHEYIIEGIHVYPECIGAFSYYTRECLEKVGLMDEFFKNAWEHVEHTYRICKANYTTPFWFFADHPHSKLMLQEIPGSIQGSAIRQDPAWFAKMNAGKQHWISKHGQWLLPRPVSYNIKEFPR